MKKAIILVSLVVGMMFFSNVFGQTEADTVALNVSAVQEAENVASTDLGVSDPGLLPTNPFYFLKEFGRNVQRVFTFNSVSKAELELKITNEKAAEVKKIQEIVPNNNEAIIKGLENYKDAQENLKNRLESLNISSTTPGIDKLMNLIASDSVLHQKVLDEISSKASDSIEVKNIIDLTKERIDDSVIVAAKENPTNFTTSLENAFIGSKGSEFKYIRSLEIIDRLENKIPEEARASLNRLRENFSDQLNENIKLSIESSNSEVVQRSLSEIPGDAIRKAVIINELKEKADSKSISALNGVSSDLEKAYINEKDLAKKAEEQIKFVKELMRRLEERMSGANNGTDIRSNIEIGKDHIQKAETSFLNKKYGEAIGQSRSAEAIIRKSLLLFEEKFTSLEDLSRQIKELYSKISNYFDMLSSRGITADSNPKAYEALNNAKVHVVEAEKSIASNSIVDAKKHIMESITFLESIFKLIEQSTINRVIMTAPIVRPIEKVISGQTSTSSVQIIKPVISICASINESLYSLEKMFKEGSINEIDYKTKKENINLELNRCMNAGVSPAIPVKPVTDQVFCTMQYDPVCAQPPMPKCAEGIACIQVMPSLKTYSNECMAKNSGAIIKYKGECSAAEGSSATTGSSIKCLRYDPVCGVNGKTYSCGEADAKANGTSVSYVGECKVVAPVSTTEVFIKEECGKENEKVNRDPLAGPVTKQCCYGLKEDRSNKLYSICVSSTGTNTITNTTNSTNTSTGSVGMANPASIFCISKGYKNMIRTNPDGSQFGVCIFSDGSECEEWKYYRGECKFESSTSIPSTSTNIIDCSYEPGTASYSSLSPEYIKSCSENGGKIITDSRGCSKCVIPTILNVNPYSY